MAVNIPRNGEPELKPWEVDANNTAMKAFWHEWKERTTTLQDSLANTVGYLTPNTEPATIAVGGRHTPKTKYRFEVRVPKRQVLPLCSYAAVRSALTSFCDAVRPFSTGSDLIAAEEKMKCRCAERRI